MSGPRDTSFVFLTGFIFYSFGPCTLYSGFGCSLQPKFHVSDSCSLFFSSFISFIVGFSLWNWFKLRRNWRVWGWFKLWKGILSLGEGWRVWRVFFPSSINEFRDFWRGSREKKKSCFEQTLQCSIAGRWEVKEEDDVLSSLSIVIASAI